ncbi:hypothetical protein ACIRBZ_17830 [Streptomyces sp. NPDC094038]|uniref:hypothetical protein n=1 Tax=Streptomyces sp. NPDC094038 TaxID=3366055 RepID=UPI0037FAF9D2
MGVEFLGHASRREIRRVDGADTAHQVGRAAAGHHRDQLGDVVPHRVDTDPELVVGLPDEVRAHVLGFGHQGDGLARAAGASRHREGTATEGGRGGCGAAEREEAAPADRGTGVRLHELPTL